MALLDDHDYQQAPKHNPGPADPLSGRAARGGVLTPSGVTAPPPSALHHENAPVSLLREPTAQPAVTPTTTLQVPHDTYIKAQVAAQLVGVSAAEFVTRAVDALIAAGRQPIDPWEPVPILGEYRDTPVEAMYVPATQRVIITSGPAAGQKFSSPSGAARAVVVAINPDRVSAQTNGWRFWRLAATGDPLQTIRPNPRRRGR